MRFAARSAELVVAAERGEPALELHLELLRRISPEESSWEATSRGPLLRLKKLRPAHWARLLAEEGHDARQGTDWSRWHHPEVERAAQRDAGKDEFARRSHARRRAIRELLPRFEELLRRWRETRETEGALMDREHNKALLATGDEIIAHFREEREESARLLGDKPGPPGVDEEQLELLLLQAKEAQRRGWLESDRSSSSWKEFRRRQGETRERIEAATGQSAEGMGVKMMDL